MKASISPAAFAAAAPANGRNRNSLKDLLVELRRALGISQQEAAVLCGLSRASIANMEVGRQAVAIEVVEKLASYRGLEVVVTVQERKV